MEIDPKLEYKCLIQKAMNFGNKNDILSNLVDISVDEEFWGFLIDQFIWSFDHNPKDNWNISDLIIKYCQDMPPPFIGLLIDYIFDHCPRLSWFLWKREFYSLEVVKESLIKHKKMGSIVFYVKYFPNILDLCMTFPDFHVYKSLISSFSSQNIEYFEANIETSWEKNSIGYYIYYDDVDSLMSCGDIPVAYPDEAILMSNLPDNALAAKYPSWLGVAAYYGSLKCFEYLLLEQSDNIPEATAPLAYAGGNIEIVNIVNQQYSITVDCFIGALSSRHWDLVSSLKERITNITSADFIISNDYIGFIDFIRKGNKINAKSENHFNSGTTMDYSIRMNDLSLLELCFFEGIPNKTTPLEAAIISNRLEIVKMVVEKGCSFSAGISHQAIPHVANGNIEIFNYLVSKKNEISFNINGVPIIILFSKLCASLGNWIEQKFFLQREQIQSMLIFKFNFFLWKHLFSLCNYW